MPRPRVTSNSTRTRNTRNTRRPSTKKSSTKIYGSSNTKWGPQQTMTPKQALNAMNRDARKTAALARQTASFLKQPTPPSQKQPPSLFNAQAMRQAPLYNKRNDIIYYPAKPRQSSLNNKNLNEEYNKFFGNTNKQ